MKRLGVAIFAAAALALAIGACGSSSSKTTTSSSSSASTNHAMQASGKQSGASGVKVSLSKVSFGNVLVGPNSHTVYLFLKDKGTTSQCNGKCAVVWAPLTSSGQPQAGSGLKASLLGTSKRSDGTMQVVYGGHPLYYFVSDRKPGQTTGQGINQFGGPWWVISPTGKEVHRRG